jgi:hypothetical protein
MMNELTPEYLGARNLDGGAIRDFGRTVVYSFETAYSPVGAARLAFKYREVDIDHVYCELMHPYQGYEMYRAGEAYRRYEEIGEQVYEGPRRHFPAIAGLVQQPVGVSETIRYVDPTKPGSPAERPVTPPSSGLVEWADVGVGSLGDRSDSRWEEIWEATDDAAFETIARNVSEEEPQASDELLWTATDTDEEYAPSPAIDNLATGVTTMRDADGLIIPGAIAALTENDKRLLLGLYARDELYPADVSVDVTPLRKRIEASAAAIGDLTASEWAALIRGGERSSELLRWFLRAKVSAVVASLPPHIAEALGHHPFALFGQVSQTLDIVPPAPTAA